MKKIVVCCLLLVVSLLASGQGDIHFNDVVGTYYEQLDSGCTKITFKKDSTFIFIHSYKTKNNYFDSLTVIDTTDILSFGRWEITCDSISVKFKNCNYADEYEAHMTRPYEIIVVPIEGKLFFVNNKLFGTDLLFNKSTIKNGLKKI